MDEINDTLAKQVLERKMQQPEDEKYNSKFNQAIKKDLEIYSRQQSRKKVDRR